MQESGNRSNIGPSVAGAVGPGQIMPATFASVARPGRKYQQSHGQAQVSGRLLDNYMQKYGDPARAAVAYFSGEGNVAPPGSSVPWKRDIADQNGKTVSSYVSDVVGRMGGQQVAQASPSYSAYQHNPWANPKEQDLARGMVTPSTGVDVYGNPVASNIMGGVQAQPVGPGATPGYRAPVTVGAEGQVSTEVPFPAPGQRAAPQSLQERLQPLVTMGQQFGQQGAANRAIQAQTGEEIKTGFASFPVIQSLNTMEDLIKKHGENMPFGPTAEWVNELKRGLAQHAPGLFNEKDFQGLAAADELKKLSAWLSTAVGRQAGGTDLSLLQGRDSVPGQHNSKEGALSLIDMMRQVQMLNARFAMDNMNNFGKPGFNFWQQRKGSSPIIRLLTTLPEIQSGLICLQRINKDRLQNRVVVGASLDNAHYNGTITKWAYTGAASRRCFG